METNNEGEESGNHRQKLGMTQLYHNGEMIGVTVVDFSDMRMLGKRTATKNGYDAAIVGYGFKTFKRKGSEIEMPKLIHEIRLQNTGLYDDENQFFEVLKGIKKVDVSGVMKGRGFSGAIKRWNFGGGPASHGSKVHRRPGSIGQHTYPGKVFKGKHMPGHYGDVKITILNQILVRVDSEKKLLFIQGSIPGSNNSYVMVRDAIKAKD